MSKNLNQKIQYLKQSIRKVPVKNINSNSNEFEHFTGFFNVFDKFVISIKEGKPEEKLKQQYFYHLEMLWGYILDEFMKPYWFTGSKGFDQELENRYLTGPIDPQRVKVLIQQAVDSNELASFFIAFPYVRELLVIDQYLHAKTHSADDSKIFIQIISEYMEVLKNYDNIFPLLVLREHVHLMLNRDHFDAVFYKKYMKGGENCIREQGHDTDIKLMFLSLFISTNIPYATRKSEGFKKFNWDAFDGLYRNLSSIDKGGLQGILEGLEKYLEELISFQLGEIKEDDIHQVDVRSIELVNVEANLEPAFAIVDHYLQIARQIVEDTEISRLATIRVITAIGEAINSLKLLIPVDNIPTLKVIIDLRDHIVHSSTYDSSRYLDSLINDRHEDTLPKVLAEIKNLQQFFNELKVWVKAGRSAANFPKISDIKHTEKFEHDYTVARAKDDRSEKLSIADYNILRQTIPVESDIDNPNYVKIEAFIKQGGRFDRAEFLDACIIGGSDLRKVHEKRNEQSKIASIRKALSEGTLDFSQISLNVKDKKMLEEVRSKKDIAVLEELLAKHEQQNDFNKDEFLNKVMKINLNLYKKILEEFIEGKLHPKEKFDQAVKIIFSQDLGAAQKWYDAYTKYMGKIDSIKRDQITQLEYSIINIKLLKDTAAKIFDGKYIDINADPIISIACEMLYGFCSNSFKSVSKFINLLHDYTDETLYFFAYRHPIEETRSLLDTAIQIRNQIFHFERVFRGDMTVAGSREVWFSMIQNMTYGIFFPEAIVISPDGVSKQEMFSESSLEKLSMFMSSLKSDLDRDPNTLNMYMLILAKTVPTKTSVASLEGTATSYTYKNSDEKSDKKNDQGVEFEDNILPIPMDGDCMYNAILHGIRRLPGYIGDRTISIQKLRDKVVEIIEDDIGKYFDLLATQTFEAIRDGDLRGFQDETLESMRDLYEERKSSIGVNRDQLDQNIRDFIVQQGVIQQYIEMIRLHAAWGGGVELGIISKILDVQVIIHRRNGNIDPPVNNTESVDSLAIDLDYSGGHYNLILNHGMEIEHLIIDQPKIDLSPYPSDFDITGVLPPMQNDNPCLAPREMIGLLGITYE